MTLKRFSGAIVSRTGIDPFTKGRGEDQLSYTHMSAVPWHLLNSRNNVVKQNDHFSWWKGLSFPLMVMQSTLGPLAIIATNFTFVLTVIMEAVMNFTLFHEVCS